MTNLTGDGWDPGEGIPLRYTPRDLDGDPIPNAKTAVTLYIQEPGETVVTKTGDDLTELSGDDAGTYEYVHLITKAGITYGHFVYDGPGNEDDVHQFWYSVRRLRVTEPEV